MAKNKFSIGELVRPINSDMGDALGKEFVGIPDIVVGIFKDDRSELGFTYLLANSYEVAWWEERELELVGE
jgi:hypothetical protein